MCSKIRTHKRHVMYFFEELSLQLEVKKIGSKISKAVEETKTLRFQYCSSILAIRSCTEAPRSTKTQKLSKQSIGPEFPAQANKQIYQEESRKIVKVKELKPKRIKGYLEYKFSQKSPALLKYLLFNDF
ncbi:hypothetical protein GQ457_16G019220 [Hibiscus cannabinus]